MEFMIWSKDKLLSSPKNC